MPRRKPDRLTRLIALGSDPAVRELAACAASAGRVARRLARWMAQHPHGCRCACCVEIGRETGGRDDIAGLLAVLVAMRGLADNVRPRTRREWEASLDRVR